MTAATIPASFVRRAHRHLSRTGRPLLYGPHRESDLMLLSEPNPASVRWSIISDPASIPFLQPFAFVLHQEWSAEVVCKLAKYGRIAVSGLPRRFETDGAVVGQLEECDGVVFVSNALTLSCLSWVLREERTGFYLRVMF